MCRYAVPLALWAACYWTPAAAKNVSEARESCTWEKAEAVSVEQITTNFREWQGKCVRVKAIHAEGSYAIWNRLLADRMAVLENDEPRRRSIMLHGRSETGHESHRPRWEEVLGTVGSCEIAYELLAEMQASESDSIIMLTGLCHHTTDHYLVPIAYRDAARAAVTRLRRAELQPEQVVLQELASSHPVYSLRRETGEHMFEALEQRNFQAFLALVEPRVAQDLIEGGEAALGEADRERLLEARTALEIAAAAYRASGIGGQGGNVMLYERWLDEGNAGRMETLEGADRNLAAFWCRLRDGAGASDLPVRAGDIDNDPSRPYFCIDAADYVLFRAGTAPTASVPLFAYGFAESAD